MDATFISNALRQLGGYNSVYIPEFTWGDKRIDALILDTKTRWARGFEIKTSRQDFKQDGKWILYTQFCSSLSFACPEGLIKPEEVEKPIGLIYIGGNDRFSTKQWVKKPQKFNDRKSISWLWTYVKIIERELPRLEFENQRLRQQVNELTKSPR